jgi:hypothetical protein
MVAAGLDIVAEDAGAAAARAPGGGVMSGAVRMSGALCHSECHKSIVRPARVARMGAGSHFAPAMGAMRTASHFWARRSGQTESEA